MLVNLDKKFNPIAGYAPLIIRLAFGLHLIYYSGEAVLTLSAGESADFLASLGIPFPALMAWIYTLTEFIGGIFLIIGFKTRWIAIPLIITFLVAAFIAHAGDPYEDSFQALQMLAVSIYFLIRGAGKLSVDEFLSRK